MYERDDEEEGERGLSWETARVVSGRLVGINKRANEITVEAEGGDGELSEEDYGLLEEFGEDQFEELVGYLDLPVRVVLLDDTVVKIGLSERLGVWAEEE